MRAEPVPVDLRTNPAAADSRRRTGRPRCPSHPDAPPPTAARSRAYSLTVSIPNPLSIREVVTTHHHGLPVGSRARSQPLARRSARRFARPFATLMPSTRGNPRRRWRPRSQPAGQDHSLRNHAAFPGITPFHRQRKGVRNQRSHHRWAKPVARNLAGSNSRSGSRDDQVAGLGFAFCRAVARVIHGMAAQHREMVVGD